MLNGPDGLARFRQNADSLLFSKEVVIMRVILVVWLQQPTAINVQIVVYSLKFLKYSEMFVSEEFFFVRRFRKCKYTLAQPFLSLYLYNLFLIIAFLGILETFSILLNFIKMYYFKKIKIRMYDKDSVMVILIFSYLNKWKGNLYHWSTSSKSHILERSWQQPNFNYISRVYGQKTIKNPVISDFGQNIE